MVHSVVGLSLLGGLVAFATALPQGDAVPSPGKLDGRAELPDVVLPDELAGLTALDSGALAPELVSQLADPSTLAQAQTDAAARVEALFGADAAFRIYSDPQAQRLAILTVLDEEGGLFVPDGPPVAPEVTAPAYDLIALGGSVCAVYYTAAESVRRDEGAQREVSRSHCQRSGGGRTYDMDAQGLEPQVVADALAGLMSANQA